MVSSIRMIRTLKLSLWLPIGVVVLSVIRFGFDPSFSTGFVPMLFSLPAMVFGLVFAWPGGIPLTRALERLHPVSRPATYVCAAVLCPLSVGAATIGGLFGPPGRRIIEAHDAKAGRPRDRGAKSNAGMDQDGGEPTGFRLGEVGQKRSQVRSRS